MSLNNEFNLKGNSAAAPVYYDLEGLQALVDGLSEEEASQLASLLSARMTIGTEIDLIDELAQQFRIAKMMQAEALQSKGEAGMKERTQSLSAVTTSIKSLVEARETVLSQERLKRYEAAIRKVLRGAPAEMREMYIDLYGEFLTADVIAELNE